MTDTPTNDVRRLTAGQLDALREVANIGAGHAATALSQMTHSTILISVPRIRVLPLVDMSVEVAPAEEPVAAILMAMLGDITGKTLLVFPRGTAVRLAACLLPTARGAPSDPGELGELGESALKEVGNILSGAYLNALSEFLGMMLLNSPPELVIDAAGAVMATRAAELGASNEYVFCVESEFTMQEQGERLRGFFMLLPDPPSLRAMLKAVRLG